MKPHEAISHFFEKKRTGELTKAEIKAALANEHHFTPEEIKTILAGISNRELDELATEKTVIERMLNSIYVSWFFLLFGLVAIGVSVFFLQMDATRPIDKYMPWIIIAGAILIIYKHAVKIFWRN